MELQDIHAKAYYQGNIIPENWRKYNIESKFVMDGNEITTNYKVVALNISEAIKFANLISEHDNGTNRKMNVTAAE